MPARSGRVLFVICLVVWLVVETLSSSLVDLSGRVRFFLICVLISVIGERPQRGRCRFCVMLTSGVGNSLLLMSSRLGLPVLMMSDPMRCLFDGLPHSVIVRWARVGSETWS